MKKLLVPVLLLNALLMAGRFWQELPVNAQGDEPCSSLSGDVDANKTNVASRRFMCTPIFIFPLTPRGSL